MAHRNLREPKIAERLWLTHAFFLGTVLALFSLCSQPVFAWQLGATSYNASGGIGVQSNTELSGQNAGGWISSTAFTDTNNTWHNLALFVTPNSKTVHAEAEYAYGGNYHDYGLCTTSEVYVTVTIEWTSFHPHQWEWYYYTNISGCPTYGVFEMGSQSINSGGEVNFMEATDCNTNDYTNNQAATYFQPTLQYLASNGALTNSQAGYSLVAGGGGCSSPPSNLGLLMSCASSGHAVAKTVVSNTNAPPPNNNVLEVSC